LFKIWYNITDIYKIVNMGRLEMTGGLCLWYFDMKTMKKRSLLEKAVLISVNPCLVNCVNPCKSVQSVAIKFCKTKPIFLVFRPTTKIPVKNKAKTNPIDPNFGRRKSIMVSLRD
jgi:hypothetical protein